MTITNVDSLSQPSKVLTTTPAITQHTNKTTTKDQPIVKSSSTSSNTGHIVNHNATKTSTKSPPLTADMLSPPKKATDHSINSIISSTAPIISHSKNENPKVADPSGAATRIINLDNLSTNDILSTAAATGESNIRIKSVESLNKSVHKHPATATNLTKPLNSTKDKDVTSKKPHVHSGLNSHSATSIQKSSAVTVPKPSIPIDAIIKSTSTPASAASKASQSSIQKSNFVTLKANATLPQTLSNITKSATDKTVSTALLSQPVEEISSDSDDVEFVSETHVKKSKNPMPNVIKHVKTSNHSSRSNSPSSNAQSSLLRRRRDSSVDGKDELDVNGIMEAIKELQVKKVLFLD